MKKVYMLMALAVSSLTIVITSCSSDDNDAVLTPLTAPTVSADAAQKAANRLTFNWNKVSDATEYSYSLYGPDGSLIQGGLSNVLTYTNKLLEPNKEYTFNVTAYPLIGNGKAQSSQTVTLKATTDKVDVKSADDGTNISMSWTNIIDADSVLYAVKNVQSSIIDTLSTTSSEAQYPAEGMGDYRLSLLSYYSGGVGYDINDCYYDFTFPKTKDGKAYLVGLGNTINLTMEMNNDNTFIIKSWYGGTKDLLFSVNADGTILPLNADEVNSKKTIYTYIVGRSEDDGDIYRVEVDVTKSYLCNAKGAKTTKVLRAGGILKLSVKSICNDDTEDTGFYTFTW